MSSILSRNALWFQLISIYECSYVLIPPWHEKSFSGLIIQKSRIKLWNIYSGYNTRFFLNGLGLEAVSCNCSETDVCNLFYYFMVNVAHFITLRKLLQATMNSFFWKKAVYSFIYFVSFSVAWHHDTSFVQSKAKILSAFKIEEVVCGFCQCFLLFVSVFYPKKLCILHAEAKMV